MADEYVGELRKRNGYFPKAIQLYACAVDLYLSTLHVIYTFNSNHNSLLRELLPHSVRYVPRLAHEHRWVNTQTQLDLVVNLVEDEMLLST
jgi:hypothetical protein